MVKDFEYYKILTELGVDKWKGVTGNVEPEEYKKLLIRCTKNLYDLKDSCAGRDCLVMGLGPSLLEINKDDYRDHVKLVCNRFYRVPDFYGDDFKPDFWCGCNDLEVLKTPIQHCIDRKIKIFVTTPNSMQFEEMLNSLKDREYLDDTLAWHWDFEILQKLVSDAYGSERTFSRAITIIIEMIAFAFWLGCDSITVAGMDLSYLESFNSSGMTHAGFDQSKELFDDKNVGGAHALSREQDRNQIIGDLKYFSGLAADRGIRFYNASHEQNKMNIDGFEPVAVRETP